MQPRSYVPHDIIVEILRRLPAKSLVRFTSVSKTWKVSIESPCFISAHMETSIDKTRSRSSHLLDISNPLGIHSKNCTLIPETMDHGVAPMQIPPPFWNVGTFAWIVGFCKGLICLKDKSIISLWNPFTRTIKKLPEGETQCTGYNLYQYLGFGFAPRRGDHRVVKLLVCEHKYLTEVEMYSLASDSWRRVKPPSRLGVFFETEGSKRFFLYSMVSFKGSIYWLVDLESNHIVTILRFDLEEENFEVIKVGVTATLEPMADYGFREYKLTVVDGYLVLLEFEFIYDRWSIQRICLRRGYIKKESESGSSSWVGSKTIELPVWARDSGVRPSLYVDGHNIVVRNPKHWVLIYEGYCDGKNLSIKSRDLGINEILYDFSVIPINETLSLLNKNSAKSVIEDHED